MIFSLRYLIKFNVSSSGLEILPIPKNKIKGLTKKTFQMNIPANGNVRLIGDEWLTNTGVELFVGIDWEFTEYGPLLLLKGLCWMVILFDLWEAKSCFFFYIKWIFTVEFEQ